LQSIIPLKNTDLLGIGEHRTQTHFPITRHRG